MQDEQFLTIPTPWVAQRTVWDLDFRVEWVTWDLAYEVRVPISDQMIYLANEFPVVLREIERQLVCEFREIIRRCADARKS